MFNRFSFLTRGFPRRWFYPLLSFMVVLGIVLPTTLNPVQALPWGDLIFRGIQVIQLSRLSDQQEVQMGQAINQQLLNSQFRLYRNSQVTNYVSQIGQRLVPASTRPNIPYTFQVVRDSNINAFATMGGFVYVTTGLLATADNEAQVASVLAHEIGHIASRHSVEQMRQTAIAQGVATAAGVDQNQLVNLGVELALNRPLSRKDELEADQRGLQTLARAGYAQIGMVQFLEKLLNQPSPPSFLSTHPATKDRIVAIEKVLNPTRANVGSGLDPVAYKSQIKPLIGS